MRRIAELLRITAGLVSFKRRNCHAAATQRSDRLLLKTLGVAFLVAASPSFGAAGPALPMKPARTLSIDTRSGTWMSLDVSPDGRTILFDMLGHLYQMPVGGGEARQITSGLGFDTQPTWSPDGTRIAFVSDRSGADNLWIANADGSNPHIITGSDDESVFTSPAWSSDGRSLFVSRYRADLNNYALLQVALDGSIKTLSPVRASPSDPRGSWQSNVGAAPSKDGRYLYFARHIGGLDYDALDVWNIIRRDLQTGSEVTIVGDTGERGHSQLTAFRPMISPDGRMLAYGTRNGPDTELRVRDLENGSDRLVADTDPDQLEASMWQDILPRYDFTPDGRSLILSRKNGFERIDLANSTVTPLPFHGLMKVAVGPSTRVNIIEGDGPIRARLVQAPIASPDGGRIAYSALGKIYVQSLSGNSAPRQLATGVDPAFQPSWSPDGQMLAYVSWSEERGGMVWTLPADGTGQAKPAFELPAYYSYPVFTPDGRSILAVRSPMTGRQRSTFEIGQLRIADLVSEPLSGGPARVVYSGNIGARPHFGNDPGSVYLLTGDGLRSIDITTGKTTLIAQVIGPGFYFVEGNTPADDMRLSPDGEWLLVQKNEQLWLVARPKPGETVDLDHPTVPVRRLTMIGADFFEWQKDGSIDWSVGSRFLHLPLAAALPSSSASPEAIARKASLGITVPRAVPEGKLLLRGARVLTMADGDRIIDNADILIAGRRIVAVGPRGSFPIPAGVEVRDVSGKTILPGFIDEHDHIAEVRRNVLSFEDWGLRARLAYGVTTSFDPSTLSIDMLAYQNLLDTGAMVGPRLRSTGPAIFSYNRFKSLDEVRAVLRRYRDDYGLNNIKEYRTGNRRVREWMAMGLHELGLQPTTEGALSMKLDLSQMIDGFAGNEHTLAAGLIGGDVIGLMTQMRTSYATTMMTTHSAPEGVDWFVVHDGVLSDPKIHRFWPPGAITEKLTERTSRPLADYRFDLVAAGTAELQSNGGLVGMGAHGEVPGIGFHWEMFAHALGGMKPMAVLHAATAGSAETIGRLHDLGTIQAGKLADLVVLSRDPLADIRNTLSIAMVMRDGQLYDGDTLATLWPDPHPLPAPWFATPNQPQQWSPASNSGDH